MFRGTVGQQRLCGGGFCGGGVSSGDFCGGDGWWGLLRQRGCRDRRFFRRSGKRNRWQGKAAPEAKTMDFFTFCSAVGTIHRITSSISYHSLFLDATCLGKKYVIL
jgi:hypothetical protein